MNYTTDTTKYEHDRSFLVSKWKEFCNCAICASVGFVIRSSDEHGVRNDLFVCEKCMQKRFGSVS